MFDIRISEEVLNDIQKRVDAATPGPWDYDGGGVWTMHPDGIGGSICDVGDSYPRGINYPNENMEFIANARSDVPALLNALRQAYILIANMAQLPHRVQS